MATRRPFSASRVSQLMVHVATGKAQPYANEPIVMRDPTDPGPRTLPGRLRQILEQGSVGGRSAKDVLLESLIRAALGGDGRAMALIIQCTDGAIEEETEPENVMTPGMASRVLGAMLGEALPALAPGEVP